MAKDDKLLDLNSLKVDPKLWMRLVVQDKENDAMHRVFQGTENPFEKNPNESMERLQNLAASGKLFVRERGRSRHFRKLEQDGENLKQGDLYEQRMDVLASDPVMGLMMRLTRGYFKWLGLDSLSNWVDKKVKKRESLLEQDALYKEEYKSLTKTEKKDLKNTRKEEKEELKQAKQKQKEEKTQAKQKEKEENKQAKQKQKEEKKLAKQKQKAERKAKKELEKAEKEKREALERQAKAEQKAAEARRKLFDINYKGEMDAPLNEPPAIEMEMVNMQPDSNANELENYIEMKDIVPEENDAEAENKNDDLENENNLQEQNQQEQNQLPPNQMAEPPQIEADKVSINQEREDQKQQVQQEKLAEEKQELDSVKEWRETIANSLFSHQEGADLKAQYETLKGDSNAEMEHLTGAFIGILSLNEPGSQKNQQLLQDMLHGKALGSENDALIREGMDAYNRAMDEMKVGNPGKMGEMFANAAKELGQQVSREPNLSTNHIMIGRMLSNVMTVAENKKLELPLNANEFDIIRGARTMSQVAQKYYDARQILGNGQVDLASEQGRGALKDLLTGNAINTMIQTEASDGKTITNTHMIMGQGLWTEKNLSQVTNQAAMKGDTTPEQIHKMLEEPNGMIAKTLGSRLSTSLIEAAVKEQMGRDQARKRENELERNTQPQMNPIQQA